MPPHIIKLWGHTGPYNDYSRYIKRLFGQRIQKISLNGGFSCPNRDGTLGTGGCSYCRVSTFVPRYCNETNNLGEQLEKGVEFFSGKYGAKAYAAYFQSYTSSHDDPHTLSTLYRSVLGHPDIRSLIIATRPDCLPLHTLELLANLKKEFGKPVVIELGIESTNNKTLNRINRHHTMEQTIQTLQALDTFALDVTGHVILGLPGETQDDQLAHIPILNSLPIRGLKIHHLQILKGTRLSKEYPSPDIRPYTLEGYIEFLCEWIPRLRPDMVVERFINEAPQDQILAPNWGGIKNYAFVHQLVQEMETRGLYQGSAYTLSSKESS